MIRISDEELKDLLDRFSYEETNPPVIVRLIQECLAARRMRDDMELTNKNSPRGFEPFRYAMISCAVLENYDKIRGTSGS